MSKKEYEEALRDADWHWKLVSDLRKDEKRTKSQEYRRQNCIALASPLRVLWTLLVGLSFFFAKALHVEFCLWLSLRGSV